METSKRRQILETVAGDERTSTADRLRALDLLDRLDGRPEADPEFEEWKAFRAMTDEEFDAELKALGRPLMTRPSFDDNAAFEAEVERRAALLANEQTAELRQEAHRLREALKQAEARLAPPTPAEPSKGASAAPSATGAVPEVDRPLRIVPPEGIDPEAGWSKRSGRPVRTSFERKIRGEV
jgi:crotonobetainyl-CoA:carnitine CoA-transferase CaiB-like acyl-CoA transferase